MAEESYRSFEQKFLIGWNFGVDEDGNQDLGKIEDFFFMQLLVPAEVDGFTDTDNTIVCETKEDLLSWADRYFDYYTVRSTLVYPDLPIL